jgi:uncharacterized protein DUF6049
VLAGVAALVGASLVHAPSAMAQPALTNKTVKVTVVSVSPSTPASSMSPQPLTVVLKLTNTSTVTLPKLTVEGDRGDPISNQVALDQAIAHPQSPDPSQVGTFSTKTPVLASLPPHGSTTVSYASTTDMIPNDAGLCICQNRIYPLYFTVHTTDTTGNDVVVGVAQSYVPAFGETQPKPVQVSWVWPIIDRPHRLDSTTFVDDDLAASVNGGRLDRVLRVVEDVDKKVPMTLVIDPELIDELTMMSRGPYQVESGKKTVPGTGTAAATLWLGRLNAALADSPDTEVDFTPPGDPDVESLSRNGLDWSVLDQQTQVQRMAEIGAQNARSDVYWPAHEVLSTGTLNAIARKGATKVIVSSAMLPRTERAPSVNALAPLHTASGPMTAVVTSSQIQRLVAPVLSLGGAGKSDLPKLVAQVAIHAIEDPTAAHYVAIVAPRTIDPSPLAAAAILATAHAFWSTPLTVGTAAPPLIEPTNHGAFVSPAHSAPGLSAQTISTAENLTELIPAFSSMLNAADAKLLLGPLPAAMQRAEANALQSDPALADLFARRLNARLDQLASGVRIFKPSAGTYTLASSNSPLPVTIVNSLAVRVFVQVRVASANGLPGFSATAPRRQSIAPGQHLILHVPTHVDRTGRFVVQATLYTPSGTQLGAPVYVSVHSTALGVVGIVITVVAAVVLALALLVRFIRRRRNPTPRPGTAPPAIAP